MALPIGYESLGGKMSWEKTEKFIASAKFALIIIVIFAAFMAVGTFLESYSGAEFAGRVLYKSLLFMAIQAAMLLSILYALLHRLPPRKKFYGFYTIHTGLILLFCGSFVTYYAGVDGQLTLSPNQPQRMVSLPRDMLSITEHGKNEASYLLPRTPWPITIAESWNAITLQRYLPFSDDRLQWEELPQGQGWPASQYRLFNDSTQEQWTMSLHPQALDFPPSRTLGPLKLHYLPQALAKCIGRSGGYVLYHVQTHSCATPEEKNLSLQKTTLGKVFWVWQKGGRAYSFFPQYSSLPWTMEQGGQLQEAPDFPWRVWAQHNFIQGPQLLLFGPALAYYEDGQWQVKSLTSGPQALPWMGFEIELLHHQPWAFPQWVPQYQMPRQVDNQLLRGRERAVEIVVQGKTYWVTSQRPLALLVDGQKYSFSLGQQTVRLPFEVNLTQFKMTTNPGTDNPASYQSLVNVFSPQGVSRHHIFMNNPLKFLDFTFYQASYFPLEGGGFGSVLSVNFDPGRPLKYLGSLLLVVGSIWHFYLRRKRRPVRRQHFLLGIAEGGESAGAMVGGGR